MLRAARFALRANRCYGVKMRASGIVLFAAATLGLATAADAACPERVGVGFGDTLASIARSCGISVETLRSVNPGLTADTLQPGTFVVVPRPALPSPMSRIGRPSVRIAPSLVPPATGISPSTTVIEPPKRPVVRRLDPMPGFGEQPGLLPGHLPLPGHFPPPGHSPPPPGHFPPIR